MRARLVLEDSTLFVGESFGTPGECLGEVVFNTSMTGYQEILTDPSYCGQIVTLTYPLIGNYGVNSDDIETRTPSVRGFVVREYCAFPSNHRATRPLGDFLEEHGIVAIEGIDTRMLTRHIRSQGAMRGLITTDDSPAAELVERARALPPMAGSDFVGEVTCRESYSWSDGLEHTGPRSSSRSIGIVVIDYGVKWNILRTLVQSDCDVTVVPAKTTASEVLDLKPDGVVLSNGPGDPAAVVYGVATTRELISQVPVFGICLGHQLVGLALGGTTYKLKFGHRGANHPVQNIETGAVEITSQNHGFAVDADSLDPAVIEVTHRSLYDGSVEGLRHRSLPVFCVQYHPEASPGPHDSHYLFRQFIDSIHESRRAASRKFGKNA